MHSISTLINRLMETDDAEIIHATRVACRRLEERLAVFFPGPRTGKIRKLRRKLRRIRRLLGGWHNCDVLLKLLTRENAADENSATQDAWKLVHNYVAERRSREIRRSRKKIEKYDHSALAEVIEKIVESPSGRDHPELLARVHAAQYAMRHKWLAALTQAEQSLAPTDIHRFRIATKRFRYRTELAHKAGDEQSSVLDALKELQDLLGSWNDRQALQRVIAEALSNPELLLREPSAGCVLLQKLEESQRSHSKAAREIIGFARAHQHLPKEESLADQPQADTHEVVWESPSTIQATRFLRLSKTSSTEDDASTT
jgi:CHAD domain-containing protein